MHKYYLIFFLLFFGANLLANESEPKTLEAVRTEIKPIIDGEIDAVFLNTPFRANNFTALNPTPGVPSDFKTEVYIIYDDQFIYVAAKLYDDEPEKMIKDLSPRDLLTNTDYFGVVLDPYRTGLSGFSFLVSAAGVQRDAKNTIEDEDSSWNEVWQSAVKLQNDGWSVEMAIPYSAIRFPVEEISNWNINFTRVVRRTREESFWNAVDPELDGFLNQMGTLKNIKDIDSPLRLSLTPYVGINVNTFVNAEGNQDANTRFAGGLDVKYGINDAFTLDMILIPDFSQVQSDVIELNLTPFEQQFDENRPFFTEGLDLFQTGDVFYTRRIGGRGHAVSEVRNREDFDSFKSLPTNNLINASKISGRTNSNTGIGVFNAIEGSTKAEFYDTLGNVQQGLINPFTNYNVVVVEQALKNNSKIAFVNTNVMRLGNYTDANVTGMDWSLRNKSQTYSTLGTAAVSQRFNPEQGADIGYKVNGEIGKISGEWRYSVGTSIESDNYNPNDLGFLFSPNEKIFWAEGSYNKFKPKWKNVARYSFTQSIAHERLYAPDEFVGVFTNSRFTLRLKSFDAFGAWIDTAPVGFKDFFEPRTTDFSSFIFRPESIQFGGFISSDYRKPVAIDVRTNYRKFNLEGKYNFNISVAPRLRLNAKIFIVPSVAFIVQDVDRGYILPEDYNIMDNIFIGSRKINTFNNGLSGQYNLNNKMSIVMQVNHFFSSVEYIEFGTLDEEGIVNLSDYNGMDEDGNSYHDINFNFFTINTVFTWRFAPGSDLVISYKSDVQRNSPYQNYLRNVNELRDFYRYGGINVKALYFLDVNRVKGMLL